MASPVARHICPITLTMMTDPVIDREGNTYERAAIAEWLHLHTTSPITRNPMQLSDLVPNRALRDEIEGLGANAPDEAVIADVSSGLTLVLVLDVSGSMNSLCSAVSASGESDGLTRLDLLKYTVKVIIESLVAGDQIMIITFSSKTNTIVPLTKIGSVEKEAIIRKVDSLDAEGQTNLYDAVRDSIRQILPYSSSANPATIIMLTDGEPTVNPPACQLYGVETGTLRALDTGLVANRGADSVGAITFHTFGYGYDLNSKLLYTLATGLNRDYLARGIFGFIPDATMLGTTLINVVASARCPGSGGNESMDDTTFIDGQLLPALRANTGGWADYNAITRLAGVVNGIADSSPFIRALLEDIQESTDPNKGQIDKATGNSVFYAKWGRHYIQSLVSAFERRTCINFKDAAIQLFKTADNQAEQDRLSQIFLTIDPPRARVTDYRYGGGSGGFRGTVSAPVNMSNYLNAAGGCFHPASYILTPGSCCSDDDSAIRMDKIKKGTRVCTRDGIAKVKCIVKLAYEGPIFQVTPCLGLTGYHPFRTADGVDYFPVNYDGTLEIFHYTGYVYDLVLDNRELVLTPDNFEVATLGHVHTDPMFDHPYFGVSQAVIKDLQVQAPYGYNHTGLIVCDKPKYERDPVTNLINKLVVNG